MEFRTDVTLGMEKPLSIPFMNGGGCVKTVEDLEIMAASPLVGAIVAGSYTLEPRDGNHGSVWHYENGVGLNSLGMPNPGMDYLKHNRVRIHEMMRGFGKALVVNIAGYSPDDFAQVAEAAILCGADAIEVNGGCPNIVTGAGGRKPIICFNPDLTGEILEKLWNIVGDIPIWFKVSPYSDPEKLGEIAKVICRFPKVKAVTAVNTFPSAHGTHQSGKPLIDVGYAGLSGVPLKHIGLGQVNQWRVALNENHRKDIRVIGVGGISRGIDILDYSRADASAFQVTTELLRTGRLEPRNPERMITEYSAIDA